MSTAPRSKSVTRALEPGLPGGLKSILSHCLKAAIKTAGNSEWPQFVVGFRDVNPFCWFGSPEGVVSESIAHSSSGGWCFYAQFIHSRRFFPSIDLSDSPDTDEPIRVT